MGKIRITLQDLHEFETIMETQIEELKLLHKQGNITEKQMNKLGVPIKRILSAIRAEIGRMNRDNIYEKDIDSEFYDRLINLSEVTANMTVGKVVSFGSKRIAKELNRIDRSHLPEYRKDQLINGIYYHLTPLKRKRAFGFGNTPAVSVPAVSVPAVSVPAVSVPAVSAAATQPATTQPAVTQPAVTQPAATQPAATQPAVTQPAATIVTTTNPYGQLAGAVQNLEQAAQGLLDTAAAQNISGFGYYY